MEKEFKLPELGEDVEEGDVLKVLVQAGDHVEADQAVLELETDKATLEVPVDAAGTVKEVKVEEGDTIRVGQVLLILDTGAEDEGASKEEPEARIAEPEREERVEAEAPEDEEPEPEPEEPERKPEPPAERQPRGSSVPAAPSVRRLARELGVDVSEVSGSGPGGRISAEDVKEHARSVVVGGASSAAPVPDFHEWGEIRREKLSGLRKAATRHLSRAWSQIPHVTQHDEADITELEELRKRFAPRVEKAGGKLTMTAIAIKIAASALGKFPRFNASLDLAKEELVVKSYRHIGVAVDTERGLLVPVVRNADRMNVTEIAVSLSEIAEKARAGKLGKADMEGGSFTVTNLGGIGGTSFTPIVNWPEVAILGISRGKTQPVWRDGSFVARLVLPLSLSYDHRVIDGADAARFLRWVAEAFEQSFVLMLEGS